MAYAMIKTGGKQIKVEAGSEILVEKLNIEAGETYEFHEIVALYDDAKLQVGKPLIKSAVVKAKVLKQGKGKKIKILRTKEKSNWARRQGHRQPYTRLFIEEIVVDGKVVAKAALDTNKPEVKKEETKPVEAPVKEEVKTQESAE